MPSPYNTRNTKAELLAMKVVDLLKVDPAKISDRIWNRLCVLLGANNYSHMGTKRKPKDG